jgi:hypothetical protein
VPAVTHTALLWTRAFAATVALEWAVAIPLLRPVEPSLARRAVVILLVNFSTHPLVWFFFPHLGLSWMQGVFLAEIWAYGFETVGYRTIFQGMTWRRAAGVSFAANTLSLLVGLLGMEWGWFR